MGKFEFDNDWGREVAQGTADLASGKLPGRLGVLQDVVGHWAIPKAERGWARYGKAALDTFGTFYSHHREQKDSRDEGRDPSRVWLKREGYEKAYPNCACAFSSFVRRALDGADFRNKTVKGDRSSKRRGRLIAFEIASGKQAFFIPDRQGGDAKEHKEVDFLWDGPFVKKGDRTPFAQFIRERIWLMMGSRALVISPTGQGYSERIELSALSDKIDYACGTDEYNDVDALAVRCQAFLSKGMHRNVLFYGPPGTGKSTLARALARNLEARAVLVDHDAVRRMNKSAHLIIWLLGPGVLILNDVDRGEAQAHRELLHALEAEYAGAEDHCLLTCLTVNDITQLDPALLRPGRIHEVREVPEPSMATVALILDYYVTKYSLILNADQRAKFLDKAKGLSPADIREFCETARAVGAVMAVEEIERIREQRKYYAGDKCREYNARKSGDECATVKGY